MTISKQSEFKRVFSNTEWSDNFYRFLQVIFHLYPEDKFHFLIKTKTEQFQSDEEIYKAIQQELPKIKPFLSELTFALPALKKQKKEMSKQVLEMLQGQKNINGYLEIGSTGRYISDLQKHLLIKSPLFLTNDIAPGNGIGDLFERGQFRKIGTFFPLNNYQPIPENQILTENIDLVTCHIGLHHCPVSNLDTYLKSIHRILRKGGTFVVRDHDVTTPEMSAFVSLVHTVFNIGLGVSWENNQKEYRSFRSANEWSDLICQIGFKDNQFRILQNLDPSDNTLMSFTKI